MNSKREDGEEKKDVTGKEVAEGKPAYIFNQFVEETSIHGVKNAFDSSKSKQHRLLWIVLGLVAIGALLKLLYELFESYSQYPVRTLVTVHPMDRLPFPAVTICNLNGVEMSKLRTLDTNAYNVSTAFGEMALFTTELRKLRGIRDSNLTLPELVETELLNKTFQDISRRTFGDLNTTLIQCNWDNKDIDCADMFAEVDMEERRCFQFNVATTARAGRRETAKSGLSSGLKVLVNVRQDEYTFNDLRSFSAGAQVILHEPDEVPDLQRGFIVSPGFTHFVSMLLKKFRFLPKPFKAFGNKTCVDDATLPPVIRRQRPNMTYTPALCMDVCWHAMAQNICGCRISNVSITYDFTLPLCTVRDIYMCYFSTFDNLTKQENDHCDCPQRCRSTDYDVTLSSAYFPSLTAQKILHKIKLLDKSTVRQNAFILKLYYDEMMYYQISHQPVHTVEAILGRVGGQMGLFIGASLLSLAELLNLLMNLCRRAARALCCAPKVTTARQDNVGKL